MCLWLTLLYCVFLSWDNKWFDLTLRSQKNTCPSSSKIKICLTIPLAVSNIAVTRKHGLFNTCYHLKPWFCSFQSKDLYCQGHAGSVEQLCWHGTHPDLLSVAGGGKSVRIWDVRSQECSVIRTKSKSFNFSKNLFQLGVSVVT